MHLTALEGAEITPGKHSDTRTKPLPLTNGYGRYMLHDRYTRTDTFFRWGMAVTYYNRYKFVAVSLPRRLRNGRFNSETAVRRFRSETATWIQKWFKISVENF
jgi:hypothetical protein